MSDLLAAADVLVHSTAGLTVLEAQIRGTRVISYGWGRGHIRANNRAYERLGLAAVARTPEQLAAAIRGGVGVTGGAGRRAARVAASGRRGAGVCAGGGVVIVSAGALRTERLLLRPWGEDDRAPMDEINRDTRVTEFLNQRGDERSLRPVSRSG